MAALDTSGPGAATPANGDVTSDEAYKRIALQSPSDLHYLQNNVRRAARAKIDLNLPLEAAMNDPRTGTADSMRRRVEEEVNAFVERTFEGVRQGIEINGMPGEEVNLDDREEYEPYDENLAGKIRDAWAKIEALNLELAERRRKTPRELTTRAEARLSELAALDKDAENSAQADMKSTLDSFRDRGLFGTHESPPWSGREAELADTWESALAQLSGINEALENAKANAEQAALVVDYIEKPKR